MALPVDARMRLDLHQDMRQLVPAPMVLHPNRLDRPCQHPWPHADRWPPARTGSPALAGTMDIVAVAVADAGLDDAADNRRVGPLHVGLPLRRLLLRRPHHNGNRDLYKKKGKKSVIWVMFEVEFISGIK